VPTAATVVIGDLSSIRQTRQVAEQANALAGFDAVIHNAGVGYKQPERIATEDGLPREFAVNTVPEIWHFMPPRFPNSGWKRFACWVAPCNVR
jgi:NAD(P)-dependent dehydrogenase (short-subunit alcohol dehydrogenase family)